MTEVSAAELVARIHGSATRFVLATTGGGSQAVSQLLTVAGASRTVLEAAVPYSAEALAKWLGARPEHFCSSATARSMAMAALARAQGYQPDAAHLAGVACTASLASDRPKHGPHRAHLALQTSSATVAIYLPLEKGLRTRLEEEQIVALAILNLLAEAAGIGDRVALALTDLETLETLRVEAPKPWQELLAGRVERVAFDAAQASTGASPQGDSLPSIAPTYRRKGAIFPGAFNPLHDGHRRMADVAETMLGLPVEFELSITNVDKPPLDFLEIERRGTQFSPDDRLWLTRAPTFVEKARLFGGPTFVVGADTIRRIADPRYYGDSPAGATAAIDELVAGGCRFLVFGRTADDGEQFHTLESLPLPDALTRLCQQVPPELFREEVSSTALRRKTEP